MSKITSLFSSIYDILFDTMSESATISRSGETNIDCSVIVAGMEVGDAVMINLEADSIFIYIKESDLEAWTVAIPQAGDTIEVLFNTWTLTEPFPYSEGGIFKCVGRKELRLHPSKL